ncbi:unnamed protein product [Rotaria magnacalcarata]|uniref:Uncharacterized protein n=1 Tax=Rotaria magnacalcarata TaxID=392030 RepID=A0A8S2LTY0_9BILA|nr:unnamed protein product [Rotaria magnacalcarata]
MDASRKAISGSLALVHCLAPIKAMQVDFISSHLTFHAHQVISIKIYNKIRDYTSAIDLLFHQHDFTNLESCVLVANSSPTKLENVIRQIKTLNKLVSFSIVQPKYDNIIELRYGYDYMDISNNTSIPSNLISLKLFICGSSSTISVYSSLSIIRFCQTIRYLSITVGQKDEIENVNINLSILAPSINENDLPILPHVISFDLEILARCDSREFVMLRTFDYRDHKAKLHLNIPVVYTEWFMTQSTAPNDHHLFYSDIEKLIVFITKKIPIVTWSSGHFQ